MSKHASCFVVYRFGSFTLDAASCRLTRTGQPVAIQPKPFEMLLYLIRQRDRVVSRAELLAELWRGVHVDEVAVRFTLHGVRRAVGDDGKRQAVIRTAPRVGFQFVAPVRESARRAPDRAARFGPSSPSANGGRLTQELDSLLEAVGRGENLMLLVSGAADRGSARALERLAKIAGALGFRVHPDGYNRPKGVSARWPGMAAATDGRADAGAVGS